MQDGQYQPLPLEQSRAGLLIHSRVLGLDLRLQDAATDAGVVLPKLLRFYDPQTGTPLLTHQELAQERERLQQERDAAQQERDAAQQERDAAQQRAEQLAARLRQLGLDPDAGG